jgi:hypothetical protein
MPLPSQQTLQPKRKLFRHKEKAASTRRPLFGAENFLENL